jgi:hypothetical protein
VTKSAVVAVVGFAAMLLAVAFVIVLLFVILGPPGESPFRKNCHAHNGTVATIHHGKTHDYLCVVGDRVIDRE